MVRRGFTLIELLVAIAVVAILLGLLLPTLARSRESARGAVCQANLRQIVLACRAYANDHDGFGPAIGQPYLSLPNWALVVQSSGERTGSTAEALYAARSSLVCPSAAAHYGTAMTRTYAMNATGHAGRPEDRGNFDDPADPAFTRIDFVQRPAETPFVLDSAAASIAGNAPPPTRTASVIDFRNPVHVPARLGFWHASRFNAGMFDGSTRAWREPADWWRAPLP